MDVGSGKTYDDEGGEEPHWNSKYYGHDEYPIEHYSPPGKKALPEERRPEEERRSPKKDKGKQKDNEQYRKEKQTSRTTRWITRSRRSMRPLIAATFPTRERDDQLATASQRFGGGARYQEGRESSQRGNKTCRN